MKRCVAGMVAVFVALCTAADVGAHRSDTSRTHNARHVAQSVYGEVCDVGTMAVPISRSAGLTARTGFTAIFQATRRPDGTFTDCRILVDDRRWSTEYLCRLIAGHEFGHAAGLKHSRNRRSIMWPGRLLRWRPCANGAAGTRSKRPLPPPLAPQPVAPQRKAMVLLLHGGGWVSGSPAQMQPWVDDFAAHGIEARAISYPFGSVIGAIEHVRRVASNEGRTILYGISAGGTLAAALAASGDVAAAVNVVGPTDFPSWNTPTGLQIKHQLRMSRAEQIAASPLRRLKGQQSPSLSQCAAADPLVLCDQALAFADRARRGQSDTTVQVMVGTHYQFPADRARARRWVQARLMADAAR